MEKGNSLGDYKVQFKEKLQNLTLIYMTIESYRDIVVVLLLKILT